jgi:1-deoxy-D-xylulose-5-phosphate synthase
MAPKDENELQHMLKTALDHDGPVAIRYPRGNGYGVPLDQELKAIPLGSFELLREGTDTAILAIGSMVMPAVEAASQLASEGISVAVINARFVKPLDKEMILSAARNHGCLVTAEENVRQGGFGTAVLELLDENSMTNVKLLRLGYKDEYVEQGEQSELRAMTWLDKDGIVASVREFVQNCNAAKGGFPAGP